jgi:CP family cyanate transporter-like MFS transporter
MATALAEARQNRLDRAGLAAVCAVGFAFSANYTNHAPMVTALAAEFKFRLAAAGLLTTGIFLTHGGIQIPGGHIVDKIGPKRVLPIALAIVCLGNIALGLSDSYRQLLFWKVFVGLGTGASFVAGARYVANAFAGPRLHLAQGYYGGSVLLGSGFVIYAIPVLSATFGWRNAFFSTAAVAVAAGIMWMLIDPDIPTVARKAAPMGAIFASQQLWLLGLVQMASFGLVIVIGVWITTYLTKTFHVTPVQAGRIGSLVLVAGVATRPIGGMLVPRWGARRTLQVGLALNVLACLCFGLGTGSLARAAAGVALLGIGAGLPYAAAFNRAAALYPARAGVAMGFVNMLGIVMILAAPPLIGQMVDWSGSFQMSFLALGAFTFAVLAATLGIRQDER